MPGSHFDRLDLSEESTVDCKTERMDWERASKSRAAEVWDRAELLEVNRDETARTVLVPNRLPQKERHHNEDRKPPTDYRPSVISLIRLTKLGRGVKHYSPVGVSVCERRIGRGATFPV
jgi:hypothetical protein